MLLTKTSYFYIDSKAFQSNIGARKSFSVFTFSTHGCYYPKTLDLEKFLNAFLTPMGPLESFLTGSNHSQELSRQKREKALICGFSKFLTQFLTSEVNFETRKFSRGLKGMSQLAIQQLFHVQGFRNTANMCNESEHR